MISRGVIEHSERVRTSHSDILTGAGVNVAIIDSGFDSTHPLLVNRKIFAISFSAFSRGKNKIRTSQDKLGHGTACAGIILEKAPKINLFSLKVFGNKLSVDIDTVVSAIDWAIMNDIKIINLSMGTTDERELHDLKDICEFAYSKEVVIVGAENYWKGKSYPAILPTVIGVTGGFIDGYGYYFRPNHPVEFVARGNSQRIAWTKPRYIVASGSSYAAAHLTAIIALLCEKHHFATVDNIRKLLIKNAQGIIP